MVVDSPTQVFDIITPHSFNIIIDNNHSLIDKPYIFLKHEKVTIDSLSIKMNQHINNTEERLRDRWMNETSLIIDKKISFEIYNHIRKQLLSINERNILFNKKISHIYKNNSKINSRLCIEKFTNHSIIKHKLLSSRIEQIELCRNWEVGFKENRDSINIKISEDNQILIDNKKVQDNHIISLLQFKYISKGKNIIFTISPSPKSTYGKYLFIRNRIKDCIDISKKEYMIEHFGRDSEDYPFSIEKWERDSLNKLFPLYEELGYF